jgi:hypothetical protein
MSKKNKDKKQNSPVLKTHRVVLTLEVVSYVDAGSTEEAIKTAEANIEDGRFDIIQTQVDELTTETPEIKKHHSVFLDEGTYYTGEFVVLETTAWTKKDWERIEDAGDNGRLKAATEIDAEKNL